MSGRKTEGIVDLVIIFDDKISKMYFPSIVGHFANEFISKHMLKVMEKDKNIVFFFYEVYQNHIDRTPNGTICSIC